MARTHTLKVAPAYFEALVRKEKNFEVRRDDRGFQKGDTLRLIAWGAQEGAGSPGYMNSAKKVVSSRPDSPSVYAIERKIKYILTGGQFGIEPGYVVMAI